MHARSDKPEIESERARRTDRLWKVGGVLLAAVATGFAVFEFETNTGSPHINGVAHLALFAKPKLVATDRMDRRDETGGEVERNKIEYNAVARSGTQSNIDFETTAAIKRDGDRPAHVEYRRRREAGTRLRFVERGRGAFETPAGLTYRGVGEMTPDGGLIHAFERRNGRWTAVLAEDDSDQTSR